MAVYVDLALYHFLCALCSLVLNWFLPGLDALWSLMSSIQYSLPMV